MCFYKAKTSYSDFLPEVYQPLLWMVPEEFGIFIAFQKYFALSRDHDHSVTHSHARGHTPVRINITNLGTHPTPPSFGKRTEQRPLNSHTHTHTHPALLTGLSLERLIFVSPHCFLFSLDFFLSSEEDTVNRNFNEEMEMSNWRAELSAARQLSFTLGNLVGTLIEVSILISGWRGLGRLGGSNERDSCR